MDPNACMQRLLAAIAAKDHVEAREALGDLINWLRAGGFAPVFTAEMAGINRWGQPRLTLVFPDGGKRFASAAIQVIQADGRLSLDNGWELVVYTSHGATLRRWPLAKEAK